MEMPCSAYKETQSPQGRPPAKSAPDLTGMKSPPGGASRADGAAIKGKTKGKLT